MKKEIEAAVQWWCEILSEEPKQDNGDALQSIFITLNSRGAKTPDEEQVKQFGDILFNLLYHDFNINWDEKCPMRGSGLRCLSVDYAPEGHLETAARKAGIDERRFPVKTIMWIDPGSITVAVGYGAKPISIYP